MTAPIKGAAVGSMIAEAAERPRVIAKAKAKGRVDDDAHPRGGVIDRPGRWRRVVIRLLRSVLRLHHLGASVRARRGRKPDYRYRQCNHNQFLPHDRYPPVVFGLNPPLGGKLQKSRALLIDRGKETGSDLHFSHIASQTLNRTRESFNR